MKKCKQLCWTCQNCTSIHKCEFVRKLNEYYQQQRLEHKLTSITDPNTNYRDYTPVKDLTNYYIKGTKVNQKGYIVECPCYVKETNQRPENTKEYLEQIAKNTNQSANALRQKYCKLTQHFERVKHTSKEELEERQAIYKNTVKSKRLEQQIKDSWRKGYISFVDKKMLLSIDNLELKQQKLNELLKVYNNQKQQELVNIKNNKNYISKKSIKNNKLLSTQQKKDLCAISDKAERERKFYELIDLIARKKQLKKDLDNIRIYTIDFTKMSDNDLINYIKKINLCYVKNKFSKTLNDSQIKQILEDFKRIIKNDLLKCDLDYILIYLDYAKRKEAEQYFLQKKLREIEKRKALSERAKKVWTKRKEQQAKSNSYTQNEFDSTNLQFDFYINRNLYNKYKFSNKVNMAFKNNSLGIGGVAGELTNYSLLDFTLEYIDETNEYYHFRCSTTNYNYNHFMLNFILTATENYTNSDFYAYFLIGGKKSLGKAQYSFYLNECNFDSECNFIKLLDL